MANTFVQKSFDNRFGGKSQTPLDQASLNALVAEVVALAHSHANKALLDTYDQTNADITDAIAKKHDEVTLADLLGPLSLTGQELDFLYNTDNFIVESGIFNTVQDIGHDATPYFAGLGIGADPGAWEFMVIGNAYLTGYEWVDGYVNGSGGFRVNGTEVIDSSGRGRFPSEYIGGAVDAAYKHKVYGNGNYTGNLIIDGNLTVNGDTVVLNAYELDVEDKNIILGNVTTPTDTTANGGGFTLKGATDKTLIWDSTYQNWTSSEHVNVASGKSYKVNNNTVIDSSRYGYLQKLNIFGPATTTSAFNLNGDGKIWGALFSNNSSVIDPYRGYYLGINGSVFERISASELHVKNFIADYQLALLGGLRVVKSSAKLAADLVISGGTGTLQIEEIPGSTGYLMESGDHIIIRTESHNGTSFSATVIGGTVGSGTRNDTDKTQSYTLTKLYGSGTTALKGSVALDYGKSGDGIVELIAKDEFGKTTIRIADFQVAPWTDLTVRTQLGNLEGLTDDTYGALQGYGLYTNVAYLTDDIFIGDTAVIGGVGVGMLNGMTALFHFDDSVLDSFNGIKPVYTGTLSESSYGLLTASGGGIVATRVSGKYGGGISVEEGSTNTGANTLFTSSASWTNYVTSSATGTRTFNTATGDKFYKTGLRLAKTDAGAGRWGVYQTNAAWNNAQHTFTFRFKIASKSAGALLTFASGIATLLQLDLSSYALNAWHTYKVTTSSADNNRYIAIQNAPADVLITAFQAENKAYATSYCEGTRAAGALEYGGLITPSAFTKKINIYVDFSKSQTSGRLFEISKDSNNRLFVAWNASNTLNFTLRKGGSDLFIRNSSSVTISAGWHEFATVFNGSSYELFVDSVSYASANVSTQIDSDWTIKLGYGSGGFYSNTYHDELAIFNRALTAKEIQKIYYANQPFNESAGMTYISGNRIRTGYIQSENYSYLTAGMLIDLNAGIMEFNNGSANVGYFNAQTGVLTWGGWDVSSDRIAIQDNILTNGYIFNLIPQDPYGRPVESIFWSNGSDLPSTGKNGVTLGGNFYLASAAGPFTSGWDTSGTFGGGIGVNINGETVFAAGKHNGQTGAVISAFAFDKSEMYYEKLINSVSRKIIRMGDITSSYDDLFTNQTVQFDDIIFEDNTKDNWGFSASTSYWSTQSKWDATSGWTGYGQSSYAIQLQELTNATSGLTMFYNNLTGTPLNNIKGYYVRISYSIRQKPLSSGTSARDMTIDFFLDSSGSTPIAAKTYSKGVFTNNVTLSDSVSFFVPSDCSGITARVWFSHLNYSGTFYAVQFSGFKVERLESMQVIINGDGLEVYGGPSNRMKLSAAGSIFHVPLAEADNYMTGGWSWKENPSNNFGTPQNALVFSYNGVPRMYIDPASGIATPI